MGFKCLFSLIMLGLLLEKMCRLLKNVTCCFSCFYNLPFQPRCWHVCSHVKSRCGRGVTGQNWNYGRQHQRIGPFSLRLRTALAWPRGFWQVTVIDAIHKVDHTACNNKNGKEFNKLHSIAPWKISISSGAGRKSGIKRFCTQPIKALCTDNAKTVRPRAKCHFDDPL